MSIETGKLALVTGASAGIGKALAELHAKKGGNLVLVARRKDRLQRMKSELEEKYHIKVYIIAKDLSSKESASEIYREIKEKGLDVDYLINNAGFSKQGYFHEIDWQMEESMIMVNVMALVELTHLFLKEMIKRNEGKILNVASSAAFAPGGPLQTIYYATKAFIVSFSQGLAGELVDKGISVTVLCPGATETEFEKVSGLDKTNLFSAEKVFTADAVARDGYDAMMDGKLVKLSALTPVNKFVLKNMNLFPTKRILEQIKIRQETK
jgi:short-subunit dehydrogenase